jgi:hypothetical protein
MVPWTSRPVVGSGAALSGSLLLPQPYFKSRHQADDDCRRGKTVVFATPYLEEADAYVDRVALWRACVR